MIDTDKYEGVEEVYLCEELHKGWTDVISKETNQPIARIYCADTVRSHSPTPAHHILMDAFKMYREVKRLREGIAGLVSSFNSQTVKNQLKELIE
tara:strand:+ start:382 stop:666 length:285 start_codon:yes stop_codon:yes gene_type:complete